MRVAQADVPEKLAEELVKRAYRYHYTSPETVFYCVWLWGEDCCGVFGDGDNAAYEWFFWRGQNGTLETSDCGYGSTSIALRDVLIKAEGNSGSSPRKTEALIEAMRKMGPRDVKVFTATLIGVMQEKLSLEQFASAISETKAIMIPPPSDGAA